MPDPTPLQLVVFIRKRFDLAELADLCLQLGVKDEDIKGVTLSEKARELVEYMERRERLPELQEAVARERPKPYAQDFAAPQAAAEPTLPIEPPAPMPTEQTVGKQIPIWAWALGILGVAAFLVWVVVTFREMADPGTFGEEQLALPVMPTTEDTLPDPTQVFDAGEVRTVMRGGVTVEEVFVPSGSFLMGSEDGQPDERPVHEVTLDAFWIDRTEVTNQQYAACVEVGRCTAPAAYGSSTRPSYYNNPDYATYPVINVSWSFAADFCTWANGGRLPSEAEWEYAARGPVNRKFPWGNNDPSCDLANYDRGCLGDTWEVAHQPDGESWVGAQDMAGNVWEWVDDWYGEEYYSNSPTNNPAGQAVGNAKVLRGGAWAENGSPRSANRHDAQPGNMHSDIGFRCVQ